jgi:hypothetical protein
MLLRIISIPFVLLGLMIVAGVLVVMCIFDGTIGRQWR